MGEQKVSLLSSDEEMQRFVRHLLNDVEALDYMLKNNWFESDVIRIGAEQEMCLVDNETYRPALVAMEALEKLKDHDWVETELAKFNLEIGMTPRKFTGHCLREMEEETLQRLHIIQEALEELDSSLILTGILPTLKKYHLELDNLTPKRRYFALMEALKNQMVSGTFELHMEGIDELKIKHNSPLLEACNTSFQLHLQIAPDNFVKMYNIAQALTGPILAVAANSPIVFGRRLWHESRIALFQQSLDTRSSHEHMRERSPRVHFGKDWIHESIMEIYREDIARFRRLIAPDQTEDSLELIKQGKVPKLIALQVHNSTVYRWNRPCYGISDTGKPHLRIEARVFPSGPSVLDEMAVAAFWLGCMQGLANETDDVRKHMSFADVRDNFMKATQYSLDSKFTWFDDEKITAINLLSQKLLPLSRRGLESVGISDEDIDRYLGVIEARVNTHRNGARWQLRGYTHLLDKTVQDEALTCLTASMIKNQRHNIPVHEWPEPKLGDLPNYVSTDLHVYECMQTDLITVQKDDIVEFVADLMDWNRIRYAPVEDTHGNLVGLITARMLLRHFVKRCKLQDNKPVKVETVMIKNPTTINQMASIFDALSILREQRIGSLPVVTDDNELVGILTEHDFLQLSIRLLDRQAKRNT